MGLVVLFAIERFATDYRPTLVWRTLAVVIAAVVLALASLSAVPHPGPQATLGLMLVLFFLVVLLGLPVSFAMLLGSPGGRNLVDLYIDGGIAYRGLIPGRSDDTLSLAVGITRFSPAARWLDAIAALQSATPAPRRSAEILLEATYQAVLAPGIALQPTVQYVAHPGGGIANPRDPDGKRVRGAAVFGLRAIIRYRGERGPLARARTHSRCVQALSRTHAERIPISGRSAAVRREVTSVGAARRAREAACVAAASERPIG